ncbi:type II secretion system F family protein [Ruminococcus sp. HUN007]|uniref:type II secretion system F family protein n=1 Tax=Ruminococcus sp. HUN007 TaxID=1514668 RepID=UPI0005D1CB08|nr:type II secretion system F family protein [Ruminococcus sp. HUN007]
MKTDPLFIMAAAGSLLTLLWTALFIKGFGKYREITSVKAARELKLNGIFHTGFELMKLLKINTGSGKFAEKRSNAAEIYGERYAGFYTYLFTGAQISYAFLGLPVSLLAGAAAGSTATGLAGCAASLILLVIYDYDVKKKVNARHDAVMCELPDIIMRLTLLLNAGMVLRDAWNTIAESSDTELGKEMRKTGSDIRNGMSETEAFEAFAGRCRTREIRKFAGSLVQNLKKGSAGLSACLEELADEQWEEKKNYVKKKAAASEQTLLFPMLMIFVAIILMIIVPVFTNMM